MAKIKICGMTRKSDIQAANEGRPDYVGFVLFFPKSRRNLSPEKAGELMADLDPSIKRVAVVVSPDADQVKTIMETGFDLIQIHGNLSEEVYEICSLPILRAFNVTNLDTFASDVEREKFCGFVFDSKVPGSGKTFDWSILETLDRKGKLMFLAGGIGEENVGQAIRQVRPDVIDLSSAVEKETKDGVFLGKDPVKMIKMIRMVQDEQ